MGNSMPLLAAGQGNANLPCFVPNNGGTPGQSRYETNYYNDYIPGDIMLGIFSGLPIESVLECRQVCKTWRDLLKTMDFVDRHLQYFHREQQLLNQQLDNGSSYEENEYESLANAKDKMGLVFMGGSNDKYKRSSLCYVEYVENDEKSYKRIRRFSISLPSETPLVTVGSCNGLVCLTTKISEKICGRVYICNPITRECVELPRLFENNNEYRKAGIRRLFYGFGYVPSTNEYKVVRIIYRSNSDKKLHSAQVQVYTLGDHLNRWRGKPEITMNAINKISGCHVIDESSHGLHVRGALHWNVRSGDERMASFDLLDEEFSFIKYPPDRIPSDWGHFKLGVLGGRLCAFRSRESSSEVWVLNKENKTVNISEVEEQERYSWTKKLTVNMNWEFMHRPFAISKSGQIFLWCKEKTVVGYDLQTSTTTQLGDIGTARPNEDAKKPWAWEEYDKPVVHYNSFVSLKRLGENTSTTLDIIKD